MPSTPVLERIATMPKAELHLHLEGSIQPASVCALAARHGVEVTQQEVLRRYAYKNFLGFLEAFKWVTSFLRDPQDYALITRDLAEQLIAQRVTYVEITLSVGVMLLRNQRPEKHFEAIALASEAFESRGLQMKWIFDAVRQFGPAAAQRVVEAARQCASQSIVAFGIGGGELSLGPQEIRPVYDHPPSLCPHCLIPSPATP